MNCLFFCRLTLAMVVSSLSFMSQLPGTDAKSYMVSPDGSDGCYDLDDALELAQPGDYIHLSDGTYTGGLKPPHGGEDGKPIKIWGSRDAIITGKNPVVNIKYSWITLKGFTVNGKYGDEDEYDSYMNKCVWVKGQGTSINSPLEGFIMKKLLVHNCGIETHARLIMEDVIRNMEQELTLATDGFVQCVLLADYSPRAFQSTGECVRLRNFVVGAEIRKNEVYDCGVYDFRFGSSGKNGEAFYIGTASELWDDGIEDQCLDNLITKNVMETNGNECVDIKEGSSGTIVEYNECSNQLDEESGCYDSRGDDNIFRYNKATDCVGAGVRLGGDTVSGYTYGSGNSVYENTFKRSEAGGINLQVSPQSETCGNECSSGPCDLFGSEDEDIENTWDQPC